jgi:hypothetical protein
VLSPLDNEAIQLFTFLQKFQRGHTTASNNTLSVDAHSIELWMLKTLCGFLASRNSPTASVDMLEGWSPPKWWIEVLFRKRSIPDRLGLYFHGGAPPGTLQTTDTSGFNFQPLRQQEIGVYGALLLLYTPRFIISMARPPEVVAGTLLEHATHRPSKLVLADGRLLHSVNFSVGYFGSRKADHHHLPKIERWSKEAQSVIPLLTYCVRQA